MKIVYSGLQYTNFDPDLGPSFEHVNFYGSLKNLPGVEVVYFPYERIKNFGHEKANAELLELIKREKPDLSFTFIFTDELIPKTLDEIKKITASVAWFSDDHWRFDNYSRHYAPRFSWVITTYSKAVERYRQIGVKNVIRSQWAANADIYKPISWNGAGRPPEVAFVGTWSRPRQKTISALKRAGIPVAAYGSGWPLGRVSEQKMLEVFSNAKINLALNPAPARFSANSLGRLFLRRSMDKIVPDMSLVDNFRSWLSRDIPQIKARHFEIPACGGFVVTSRADDLENYYEFGEETVVYNGQEDMVKKIKYYLEHDDERKRIAAAGHKRTLKEHTYKKRFEEIFKAIGLKK